MQFEYSHVLLGPMYSLRVSIFVCRVGQSVKYAFQMELHKDESVEDLLGQVSQPIAAQNEVGNPRADEDRLGQEGQSITFQIERQKVRESVQDRLRQRTQLVPFQLENHKVREAPEDSLGQTAEMIAIQLEGLKARVVEVQGSLLVGAGPGRGLREGGRRELCAEWARRGHDHPASSYHEC